MRRFVGRPLEPDGNEFLTPSANGEPPLPAAFRWDEGIMAVRAIRRTWRSTKSDRGDVYLKRHWFEIETFDGSVAQIYFDREAGRGRAHWWLYTVDAVDKL